MAYRNGPKIITDGLVLCLDAAISKSYPGSGTTWYDLSTSNINATLVNTPTFLSGANRGIFSFSGTNDRIEIDSFGADSNRALSVFCWVYSTDFTHQQSAGVYYNWIINKRPTTSPNSNSWQMTTKEGVLGANMWDSNNNALITNGLSADFAMQENQWYHVGFVTNGITNGYITLYINGVANSSTTIPADRGLESKKIHIGRAGWFDALYWKGYMAQHLIYKTDLSPNEVRQNFNATRGRFGV